MNMTVKNEFNIGTVIPIVIFLIGQSIVAVWGAATIYTNLQQLTDRVELLRAEQAEVERRQWDRISATERQLSTAMASGVTFERLLESVLRELSDVRTELRRTNDRLDQQVDAHSNGHNGDVQ